MLSVIFSEHLNNDITEDVTMDDLAFEEPYADVGSIIPMPEPALASTSAPPTPRPSPAPSATPPAPQLSPPLPAPAETDSTPAVDPDLLQALGDSYTAIPEWGNDILQDISQRWEPIFKDGLKKEVKDELIKKYLYPKNLPLSKPPKLNPEIAAVLTEACKNRDTRVTTKQGQLGNAVAALGHAMTGILTKNLQTSEILRILNDVGKLIADSHYSETETRRALIMPLLDKSYLLPLKDRKRDSTLFGEKLGEFIKSSRGFQKTAQLITPPASATSSSSSSSANLNWRGPPRQQRQARASRGGGQRAAMQQRRAMPPPPPPPARRRAPPAPNPRRPATQTSTRLLRNTT